MIRAPIRLLAGVTIVAASCGLGASAEPVRFERGDCNADGAADISDAIFGLLFLFGGGEAGPCADACDANDDGGLDVSDPIALLGHLFLGASPPPAPYGACGADPTADDLACAAFVPCTDECADEVAAIAAETGGVGSCSAIVRLDYWTRRILGWQLVCGKYARIDEATARARAQGDTGHGAGGAMLNPPDPEDAWIFFESPLDFGGVGVVSARTGLSLFGGSIVWLGTGDISYPVEWRPPATLGNDCSPIALEIPSRGYDLSASGGDLETDDVLAALDVVRGTALPEGIATSGYVFDAMVLLYPRSVGAFNPRTAEWIVILNGGFLE